jgi:two-component system response regulator RegA
MGKRRLLLVDDNEVFYRVLAEALEAQGFTVDCALQYEDALHRIQQYPPEYALLDLNLKGPSGLGLIQPLRALNRTCRIVMLTGYASIATAVDAVKLGANHYLAKPVAVPEIVRALNGEGMLPKDAAPDSPLSVRKLQWEHIHRVLAEHGGGISAAARALRMHRRTLQRKLARQPPE